jgi:hypothetical protein
MRFLVYILLSVGFFFILNFIKGSIPVVIYYITAIAALALFTAMAWLFETGKIAVFKPIK